MWTTREHHVRFVAKYYFPSVSDLAESMPRETNAGGDFDERSPVQTAWILIFDIDVRGAGIRMDRVVEVRSDLQRFHMKTQVI
jgi:hypothetical protein